MEEADPVIDQLAAARRRGDENAVVNVLEGFRPRLRRMVELRLDPKIRKRLDPSDVIQEAYLEVLDGLDGFLSNPRISFYLWLRFITGRKLLALHRRHLGAQIRDAEREISIHRPAGAVTSSISLADYVTSAESSPSGVAQRRERRSKLIEALEALDPVDREILTLRYFEELSNRETAEMLGLNESTTSTRFVRALQRMKVLLDRSLGG